jgi:hypothetical protein
MQCGMVQAHLLEVQVFEISRSMYGTIPVADGTHDTTVTFPFVTSF